MARRRPVDPADLHFGAALRGALRRRRHVHVRQRLLRLAVRARAGLPTCWPRRGRHGRRRRHRHAHREHVRPARPGAARAAGPGPAVRRATARDAAGRGRRRGGAAPATAPAGRAARAGVRAVGHQLRRRTTRPRRTAAGIAAAIRDGARAGRRSPPEDIDLVLAARHRHHRSTTRPRRRRCAEVFGPAAGRPLLTAMKSMTGHTSGALRPDRRVVGGHGRWPPAGSRRRSDCASRWPRRRRSGSSGITGRTGRPAAGPGRRVRLRRGQRGRGAGAGRRGRRRGPQPRPTAVVVTGVGLAVPGVADAAALPGAPGRRCQAADPSSRAGRARPARACATRTGPPSWRCAPRRDALRRRRACCRPGPRRRRPATRSGWWSAPTSATRHRLPGGRDHRRAEHRPGQPDGPAERVRATSPPSVLATRFGLRGPNLTLSQRGHLRAGRGALGRGCWSPAGRARRTLVVGVETGARRSTGSSPGRSARPARSDPLLWTARSAVVVERAADGRGAAARSRLADARPVRRGWRSPPASSRAATRRARSSADPGWPTPPTGDRCHRRRGAGGGRRTARPRRRRAGVRRRSGCCSARRRCGWFAGRPGGAGAGHQRRLLDGEDAVAGLLLRPAGAARP